MRSFALVVLNSEDQIIDRFDLDLVEKPTGFGFKLNMSKITGDLEDIITKVVQSKNVIKLKVLQHNNAYIKSNVLANWIQKYSTADYIMALEYNDTNLIKYCEGKVTSLTKNELDEYKLLTQDLEFTQTTPFFIKRENKIVIQKSDTGKSYPTQYPYNYGSAIAQNNEINNPYILDVPLIIEIDGGIDNPTIDLLDENDRSYNRVSFNNEILLTGEKIIINSAQRKIYKVNVDGEVIDYVPNVNPEWDTFLRAKAGITKISINTNEATDGFKLTGGWRQYTL